MAFLAAFAAVCVPRGAKAALRRGTGGSAKTRLCKSLSSEFPRKVRFVELNGGAARIAGRRLCNNRIRFRNGMIGYEYGNSGCEITNGCREVSTLLGFAKELRARNIPLLFVLAPCKMSFDGRLLPAGWECDNLNEQARSLAGMLADSGVEVLDLVPRYASTREDVDAHFFITDHHWNVKTAFEATGLICARLADILGEPALRGDARLDPASWKSGVLKSAFLGAHGRRTGRLFSGVEDFEYILPEFKTSQVSFAPGIGKRREGDYGSAELDRKYLRPSQRDWRWLAYGGPAFGVRMHRNLSPSVDLRCMVVKDSFGRHPVSFMSTVFREVVEVDPRLLNDAQTVDGAVDAYRPDVVVIVANPSSLLGKRWIAGLSRTCKGKEAADAFHVD